MKSVEAGTVIGECECASCGSIRPIKITKKGTAGFRCGQWITNEDGTKHQCSGSSWLSKQASEKLINEYLGTPREEKSNDVQQHENTGVEGHNTQTDIEEFTTDDRRDREQRADDAGSGLFGGIFG